MEYRHDAAGSATGGPDLGAAETGGHETFIGEGRKVGRNELCPCGSGNKYKHCHGKLS
jgi:preprotein translocase subunit SecA